MKREQAIELKQSLTDANRALDRARRVIAGFAKEDRIRFRDLLGSVLDALHSELLAAIYAQHPDLEPPLVDEEVPVIDSDRRWDEVRLPPPMTEAEFDQVNHSTLSSHWRKVARIVTDVVHKCERIGLTITTK